MAMGFDYGYVSVSGTVLFHSAGYSLSVKAIGYAIAITTRVQRSRAVPISIRVGRVIVVRAVVVIVVASRRVAWITELERKVGSVISPIAVMKTTTPSLDG
jgi:hypothetical protein